MKIFSPIIILVAYFMSNGVFAQKISDSHATKEAILLYNNLLKTTQHKKYLVGHQDDLAYGVHWKYKNGKSDVKDVTGDYPALYGWELADLELGHDVNIDSVPFDKMKDYIRFADKHRSVVTISWHINNPVTGKNAWDTTAGAVKAILPGGEKHAIYVAYLNKVAAFIQDLKDEKGELIPILYRPFHELTGNWFWWGVQGCTPEDLQAAYRFTVDYLRNERQLHNLIIVYNTGDRFTNASEFLRGYPGDDYVDVVSFDTYQYGEPSNSKAFGENLDHKLALLQQIATEHNKMMAVAEMGYNKVPDRKWFTQTVSPFLAKYPIAYTLFWRNAGFKPKDKEEEYYVPYKGHPAEENFKGYYKLPETLFANDWQKLVEKD
ncbi:glycoside hydrolase family 26 protein [Rhizosphaericola mali]|uniref:Mannan endo-1,4-beta-mannosidase n=1 Tax=Rhizosphaericola mali TaxID=2545455 RepID=A0A5P2G2W8_9BACT|nr:glycosyl hydrolase [Rhizosphaericola mali]QES89835.1 beta-mannosidase [Rhizosphaericola mali]